jgi:uncharacterized surface protein with fasciclin (FAS1) repeats
MNENYDLVETAKHAGNFRIFLQALEATGLTETLQRTGPYTILAPVDDAFLKFPKTLLQDLFSMENRPALHSMLKNHIIAGNLLSQDLITRDEIRSMKDEPLRIESRQGLRVNSALVITPDLKASNGVVHAIDALLLPQARVATAR